MKTQLLALGVLLAAVGCSRAIEYGETKTVIVRQEISELEKEEVPGTQHDVWVEPMPEYVRVPSQIDPHGVYYRKGHNTLVEGRPGKYQHVQFPDYNGNYRNPQ